MVIFDLLWTFFQFLLGVAGFICIVIAFMVVFFTIRSWFDMRYLHEVPCKIRLKTLKEDVAAMPWRFELDAEYICYKHSGIVVWLAVSFWEYVPYLIWLSRYRQTALAKKYQSSKAQKTQEVSE